MFSRAGFPAFAVLVLTLAACSTTPPDVAEKNREQAPPSTDACLARPELSERWGECNVKRTIYDHMDAIGVCQRKYGKGSRSGDVLMLKIHVGRNGLVKTVQADDTSREANKPLQQCLSREIGSLRFAAPPKGVKPIIYFPYQTP